MIETLPVAELYNTYKLSQLILSSRFDMHKHQYYMVFTTSSLAGYFMLFDLFIYSVLFYFYFAYANILRSLQLLERK